MTRDLGKISVRDIAEQIAKTPEALPSAMERVRHWTREGLLNMVGDLNPGTGRKRYYDEKATTFARILNAMANAGIEVSKAKTLEEKTLRNILETVWIVKDYKQKYCITILYGAEHDPKGTGIVVPMEGALNDHISLVDNPEMAIVINLHQILKG